MEPNRLTDVAIKALPLKELQSIKRMCASLDKQKRDLEQVIKEKRDILMRRDQLDRIALEKRKLDIAIERYRESVYDAIDKGGTVQQLVKQYKVEVPSNGAGGERILTIWNEWEEDEDDDLGEEVRLNYAGYTELGDLLLYFPEKIRTL